MKSTRNLRVRLRLIEGALVFLFGLLTAGAIATHQLLLDGSGEPVTPISLSGEHWTGTLNPSRLPANVPLLTDNALILNSLNVATVTGLSGGGGPDFQEGLRVREQTIDAYLTSAIQEGLTRADDAVLGVTYAYTLSVGEGFHVDLYGDLATPGRVSAHDLFVADAAIADADGYVLTGHQSYQSGTVTPTGYLTFKDATGTVYRVPAIAAPAY